MAPRSEFSLFACLILDTEPNTCATARPLSKKETNGNSSAGRQDKEKKKAIREVCDD